MAKREPHVSKAAAMTTHGHHLEDLHPAMHKHFQASAPAPADNEQNEAPEGGGGGTEPPEPAPY